VGFLLLTCFELRNDCRAGCSRTRSRGRWPAAPAGPG
jgi:hypothetical protein